MSIELRGLTKSFGDVLAVDDLSAVAQPGQVTALLGPNGAGKTTTLRMLLGLVAPSGGTATFGGRRYAELPDPVRQVGAVLEASGYHPGRTGLDHLRILATASRLPHDAPERGLAETGLAADAHRRVGGFSLGMRQRLGIAAAMLGDPKSLVLDEPTNGLDPPGGRGLRKYLRGLADEGRTVLLSSHALSEVELIADHVLVMAPGGLLRSSSLASLGAPGWLRLGGAARRGTRHRAEELLEVGVAAGLAVVRALGAGARELRGERSVDQQREGQQRHDAQAGPPGEGRFRGVMPHAKTTAAPLRAGGGYPPLRSAARASSARSGADRVAPP